MRARNDIAVASPSLVPAESKQAAVAAQIMGHLSDPTRLQLLRLLSGGDQDVNTLTAQVAASRSSVSQHLGRLRLAGLVTAHRNGRRMLYHVTSDHIHALVEDAYQFAAHLTNDIPHHRNR